MLLLVSLGIGAVGGILMYANFYYAGKYFMKAFRVGDTSDIMFETNIRNSFSYLFFGQWVAIGIIVSLIAAMDTWAR